MKWDKREVRLLLGVIITPNLWLWGKVNAQWDKTLRATLDTGHVPQEFCGDYTLHGVEVSERGVYENITKPHNTLYPSRRTALLFRLTFKHAILQDSEKAIDTVCNKLIIGVDKGAPEQPEMEQVIPKRQSPFYGPNILGDAITRRMQGGLSAKGYAAQRDAEMQQLQHEYEGARGISNISPAEWDLINRGMTGAIKKDTTT